MNLYQQILNSKDAIRKAITSAVKDGDIKPEQAKNILRDMGYNRISEVPETEHEQMIINIDNVIQLNRHAKFWS